MLRRCAAPTPEFSLQEWLQVPPNIESISQQRYFEGLAASRAGVSND